MFSRATRISQRLPPCRGILNQQLNIRLASTQSADATPRPKSPPVRTAYLRAWRPVTDIAELYSVVRVIEKRYGKVLHTHFLKDYEDTTRYQMMSYIVFADPQSLQRIPESGIELTAPAHPVNKPYYEIGINDVESVIFNDEVDGTVESPAANSKSPDSVIGFKLMRSTMDYVPDRLVRGMIYQSTPYRTMEHFQNWGGFAKLEPLDPPRTIVDRDLFADRVGIDQNRMRAALQICARHFRPNPNASTSRPAASKPATNDEPSPAGNSSNSTQPPTPSAPTSTPEAEETLIKVPPKNAKSEPKSASKSIPESTPELVKEASTKSAVAETPASPTADALSPNTPQQVSSPETPPKKQQPVGPKLAIPPQVQKSTAPPRKKEPKPKIRAAKETPAKPRPTITQEAKSQPEAKSEPETKSQPEPPKPKSTLAKIWDLFGRS